jgi:broad specificity phosphatase PhoE
MTAMLRQPWVRRIGAVYCSPEKKSVDCARILTGFLGFPYQIVEALGEIDRSATGYLPPDEHRATADLLFSHPDDSIRGWETARDAQHRMVAAIESVLAHPAAQGDLAILTHGGVAALYLCHLKGIAIDRGQEAPHPGGGCYYCFAEGTRALLHGWKTIDG